MPTEAPDARAGTGTGNFKGATTGSLSHTHRHTATTPTAVTSTTTSVTRFATSTAPRPLLDFSPTHHILSSRQTSIPKVSYSDYSNIEHVTMIPSVQLTLPNSPPLPQSENATHSDSVNTPSASMAAPALSPRNLPLPPSPPFQYDSDNENDDANDSDNASPPPARYYRESDSSISRKPVIHQQSLPFRTTTHTPSTPNTRPHTSSGIAAAAPLMQRAHSSPGVDSLGRFVTPQYHSAPRRPASPLSAGSRRRSPLRSAMEESYSSWSGLAMEPNIPEHAELDLSEDYSHMSPMPSYHTTFPRSRRRPTSPLHPSASAPSLNIMSGSTRAVSPHTTGTSSPGSGTEKRYFANESYPTGFSYSYSSAGSMPSTPSSLRSRSPSISSLETIEDSPDAEEAAMNAAEEDAKYRVDESMESGESRRRGSLEIRGSTLRSNKERKRWSVCGAERRADFSLEVIEE